MDFLVSQANAQPAPPAEYGKQARLEQQARELQAELQAAPRNEPDSWWSVRDAMTISAAVLIVGLITVLIAAYLVRAEKDGHVILRVLATILILTFAVFLIVAGYSDQQIAPAMGLLGTIAGYLLGKESRKETAPPPPA